MAESKGKLRHPAVQGGDGAEAAKSDPKIAETDDQTTRGQTRMHIGAGHGAAPIEAPDAANQIDPIEGDSRSSNNPVAALAGIRTGSGDNHVAIVDENGDEVSLDGLFEDSNPALTYRIVKQRVHERFQYPGARQHFTRLLWPAGYHVGVAEVARLAHAQELGKAQLAQEQERRKVEDGHFPPA